MVDVLVTDTNNSLVTSQNLVLDGSEVQSGVEATALLGNGASVVFANIVNNNPVVTTTGDELTYDGDTLIYRVDSVTKVTAVATSGTEVFTLTATVTNGVASYDLDLLQPIDPLILTSESTNQAFTNSRELTKTQDYGGVTISASAFEGNSQVTLNGNNQGLGVQGKGPSSAGSNLSVDSGEMVRFDFASTNTAKAVGLTSFTLGIIQTDTGTGKSSGTAVNGIWIAYRVVDVPTGAVAGDTLIVNGNNHTLIPDDVSAGTVAYAVAQGSFGAGQLVIAPGVAFDRVELTTGGGGSFAIESSQDSFTLEEPATIDLQAMVDSSLVDFSITFDQLAAGDATMEAVDPGSLLIAGAGSETLVGLTGEADTFEWNLADGTAEGDTILGFEEGTDAIDLSDLLTGYDSADNLTDFISVTTETVGGQTNTIISINSDGEGEDTDQKIVVEGVDWVGSETDMASILNSLITSGKIIDPDTGG